MGEAGNTRRIIPIWTFQNTNISRDQWHSCPSSVLSWALCNLKMMHISRAGQGYATNCRSRRVAGRDGRYGLHVLYSIVSYVHVPNVAYLIRRNCTNALAFLRTSFLLLIQLPLFQFPISIPIPVPGQIFQKPSTTTCSFIRSWTLSKSTHSFHSEVTRGLCQTYVTWYYCCHGQLLYSPAPSPPTYQSQSPFFIYIFCHIARARAISMTTALRNRVSSQPDSSHIYLAAACPTDRGNIF